MHNFWQFCFILSLWEFHKYIFYHKYPLLLLHPDTHTSPSHLILYPFYFKNQKGQLVLPINSWMYAFPLEYDRFIMDYTFNINWSSLFQTLSISSNCSTMGGTSIATILHNVRTSFLELVQSCLCIRSHYAIALLFLK